MSQTIAQARAAAVTALTTGGMRVDPDPGTFTAPCVYVFSNGCTDLRGVGRGQVPWGFRFVLRPISTSEKVAAASLADMLATFMGIFRALPGWSVDSVSPDVMRQTGGSDYLSADITATTMITL